MSRKLSLAAILLLIPMMLFAQGAKELDADEKVVRILSVSEDNGSYMVSAQTEEGIEEVYIIGDDTEVTGIDPAELKANDYIAVKDKGMMTMSIPPQLPALSVRYVTPLVASGLIPVHFDVLSHPEVIVQVAEVDPEDIYSAFSYSYGYLSMEGLKAQDIYPEGGYFARGIIDAGALGDSLMTFEEMDAALSSYIQDHIQKGLPVRYEKVTTTREAIDSLESPSTDGDRFAYAYGYFSVMNLMYSGLPVNAPEFADGALTSLYGAAPLFTEEEMNSYIDEYIIQLQAEYDALIAEMAEENLARAETFLEDNAAKEGVQVLSDAVQIEFTLDDTASDAHPAADSNVNVDYTLRDMDGNVLDQGEGIEFNLQNLIPGFAEAALEMTPGDSLTAYIHPSAGYGENGTGTIEPNTLLIFDITLNEIL